MWTEQKTHHSKNKLGVIIREKEIPIWIRVKEYTLITMDEEYQKPKVLSTIEQPQTIYHKMTVWALVSEQNEPVSLSTKMRVAPLDSKQSFGQSKISSDPFSISLENYLKLDYTKVIELQNEVSKRCSELIKTAWKNGKTQVIICQGNIIYETEELKDIPNELVKQLADKYQKPCYVFVAPDKIEECGWNVIDGSDSYPTLCLYVGMSTSDEKELVKNTPIEADFDTGNPYLRAFNADMFPSLLSSFSTLDLRSAIHLSRDYHFFQKKVKICVKDIHGEIHSIICDARLVINWNSCALLQVSPHRRGFVGRDFLRDLRIKVELDPSKNITRILGS